MSDKKIIVESTFSTVCIQFCEPELSCEPTNILSDGSAVRLKVEFILDFSADSMNHSSLISASSKMCSLVQASA